MATPVGHYLLGLSITQVFSHEQAEKRRGVWMASIACLPDLDVIPGLFVGEIAQFHHGATHSFTAAAIFSVIGLLIVKWRRWNVSAGLFFLLFFLYASHAILDFFTLDTGEPYGVPLFWPWILETYQSPWLLLPNVQHTRAPLLSSHNLFLTLREGLVFLPLIGLIQALKVSRRPWPSAAAGIYGGWFLIALWVSVFFSALILIHHTFKAYDTALNQPKGTNNESHPPKIHKI